MWIARETVTTLQGKHTVKHIVMAVCLVLTGVSGMASAPGSARAESSIPIYTMTDVQSINNDLSGTYRLMNDLDASGISNFTPIGAAWSSPFTGIFDGQGHVIRNLTIDQSAANYVGLFAYVAHSGTVKNVRLANENVSGQNYVGGLIGWNDASETGGAVESSSVDGKITGQANVGGLVGNNWGTITGSHSTARVVGVDSTGGVAGYNGRSITTSYSTGIVTGGDYTGGLVGWNQQTIGRSYSSASATGRYDVGGLVGWNNNGAATDNSYSRGAANGVDYVGGLLGVNHGASKVTRSYSTGAVTGSAATAVIGGLIGLADYGSTVTQSYWDRDTSGQTVGVGHNDGTDGSNGLSDAEMTHQAGFSGFDFGSTWGIHEGVSYPYLMWQSGITAGSVEISPISPTSSTAQLTATPTGFVNNDAGPLTYHYSWKVKHSGDESFGPGTGLTTANTLSGPFTRGDVYEVEVYATDDQGDASSTLTSNPVTIGNSAPLAGTVTIDQTNPTSSTAELTATRHGFTDPDGDALTYYYSWNVKPVGWDEFSSSPTKFSTSNEFVNPLTAGDTYVVMVQADDGHGGLSPIVTSAPVTVAELTPTTPGIPTLSSGSSTPNQGVFTLSWTPSTGPAGITYTLLHSHGGSTWSPVASGLNSPSYAFAAVSSEAEGRWYYRVQAAAPGATSSGWSDVSSAMTVDRTPPTIAFSGGGSYTTDQTVSITCLAGDPALADGSPGSGVASTNGCGDGTPTTVKSESAAALFTQASPSQLDSTGTVATYTLTASATDRAGNTGIGGTTITIQLTNTGLQQTVTELVADPAVIGDLNASTTAAQRSARAGNFTAAANQMGAFIHKVEAQSGKKIPASVATTLITLATHLQTAYQAGVNK